MGSRQPVARKGSVVKARKINIRLNRDSILNFSNNMGVMAALVLFMVMSVTFDKAEADFLQGDYRFALFMDAPFRKYAAGVLERQSFNFTADIPGFAAYDMKAILTRDDLDFTRNHVWNGPYEDCPADFHRLAEVAALTQESFPMKFMKIYFLRVSGSKSMIDQRLSKQVYQYGFLCQLSNYIPFVSSLMVFAVASILPIQDAVESDCDATKELLERNRRNFAFATTPLLSASFVCLIWGVYQFYYFAMLYSRMVADWPSSQTYTRVFRLVIYLSMSTILVYVAIASCFGGGIQIVKDADEIRAANDRNELDEHVSGE